MGMADPSTLPQTQNLTPSPPEEVSAPGSAATAIGATAAAAAAAAAPAPESKKRKLEDGGLQNSSYFKIRSIIRDLRPLFIEVISTPEFRNNKASQDIQKQMKIIIELSKEMRHSLASSGKLTKLPVEEPSAGGSNDRHAVKPQGGETHASQPQTVDIPSVPNNISEKMSQPEKIPNLPGKESLPGRARNVSNKAPARAPEEKITGSKELGKQPEEGVHGTYVVGGSPIGWNFILYPGGESVYYGVTKESARLRQAAK